MFKLTIPYKKKNDNFKSYKKHLNITSYANFILKFHENFPTYMFIHAVLIHAFYMHFLE